LFKKVQFLGFCVYNVVSLSGIEAGCAVVLVRLDSTMFDAHSSQTLLPGLHIGGRGIFKKVQFLGILHLQVVSLSE